MTKEEIDKIMPMYNNYFYKPDGLALKHMIYFMSNSDVDYATFYQTIREIAESRENKREQTGSYPQKLSFMQVERTFHTNKRRNISRARSDSREPSQFCSKCDGIGLRYAIICVEDSRLIQVDLSRPVESSQYWSSGVACACTAGEWCNDNLNPNDSPYSMAQRKWIMKNSFRTQSEASVAMDKIRGLEMDNKSKKHEFTMSLYNAVKTANIKTKEFTNA